MSNLVAILRSAVGFVRWRRRKGRKSQHAPTVTSPPSRVRMTAKRVTEYPDGTRVTEECLREVDTDRELSIKVENVVRSATTVHLELVRDEQEDPDCQDAP